MINVDNVEIIIGKTGEVVDACRINLPDRNSWDKVWFGNVLAQCKILGNKQLTVLLWMVNNRNYSDNKVYYTQSEISELCGVRLRLLKDIIKSFCECKIITKIRNSVYMVNPAIIVRGDSKKQAYLLIEFNNEINKKKGK